MPEGNGQADLRDRPMAELAKQLSAQTATLVRQEMELAKAELERKGKKAGLGAGMFGGAGVVGWFGLGALTAAEILALSTAVDAWLAALIVAVVYFAIAGVLALMGKRRVQEAGPPVPEQTVETLKQDVDVTKQRVKEARS